jgi:hypothetical protein
MAYHHQTMLNFTDSHNTETENLIRIKITKLGNIYTVLI